MKGTGIIRRVDDLGRVVIPKDIRRTLQIHENDPLEIFVTEDGGVVFRPYQPSLATKVTDLASEITETLDLGVQDKKRIYDHLNKVRMIVLEAE